MWRNIDTWKSALQDGVLEFSGAALSEMRTTVTQSGLAVLEGALEVAKDIKEDVQAVAQLAKEGSKMPSKFRDNAMAASEGQDTIDTEDPGYSSQPNAGSSTIAYRFAAGNPFAASDMSGNPGGHIPNLEAPHRESAELNGRQRAHHAPDVEGSNFGTRTVSLNPSRFSSNTDAAVHAGRSIASNDDALQPHQHASQNGGGAASQGHISPDLQSPAHTKKSTTHRLSMPDDGVHAAAGSLEQEHARTTSGAPNTPQPIEGPTPTVANSRSPSPPVAAQDSAVSMTTGLHATATAALAKAAASALAKVAASAGSANRSSSSSSLDTQAASARQGNGVVTSSLRTAASEQGPSPNVASPAVSRNNSATAQRNGSPPMHLLGASTRSGSASPVMQMSSDMGILPAIGLTDAASGASHHPSVPSLLNGMTVLDGAAVRGNGDHHGSSAPAGGAEKAPGPVDASGHQSLSAHQLAETPPALTRGGHSAADGNGMPTPSATTSLGTVLDFQEEVQQLRHQLEAVERERAALASEAQRYKTELVAIASDTAKHKAGYGEMTEAYQQVKALLAGSMAQCESMSEAAERREQELREARASAEKNMAAADAARKEAADVMLALATARAEAAQRDKELARLQAALDSAKQQHTTADVAAELEDLRLQLSAAVQKMAAALDAKDAAELRLAEAEAARAQSEEARAEAERLRREAQAEAHAAHAAAEAERSSREEAQGISASLKEDNERRARVFNNAVRAAVWKVQRDLDTEREELEGRIRELQKLLHATQTELGETALAADEARAEAAARTRDAEAAGMVAVNAEQAADRSRAGEREALQLLHKAEASRNEVAAKLEREAAACAAAQEECSRLRADMEAGKKMHAEQQQAMEQAVAESRELAARQRQRADDLATALRACEAKLEAANAAGREASERAGLELVVAQRRVEELQTEVKQLRASSSVMSIFTLPTKDDVIAGLGLEKWRDDRLKSKPDDIEAGLAAKVGQDRGLLSSNAAGKLTAGVRKVAGHVSTRVWLLVLYLVLLHMAVMVSFTHQTVDVTALCGSASFPGQSAVRLP